MYWAIIKKELKFIIPLTILAVIVFWIYILDMTTYMSPYRNMQYNFDFLSKMDHRVNSGYIDIGIYGVWMYGALVHQFVFSILAILIAFVQFTIPSILGNWKYILFRPVQRRSLLLCMLLSGLALTYIIAVILWYCACLRMDSISLVPIDKDVYYLGPYQSFIPVYCYLTVAIMSLGKLLSISEKLPAIFTFLVIFVILINNPESYIPYFVLSISVFIAYVLIVTDKFCSREY